MAIPNSDSVPAEFMPGCQSGVPGNSPGSAGASGSAADNQPAGPVTPATGAWQDDARFSASTSGTVMPGQTTVSDIVPGPADDLTHTGAGSGQVIPSAPRRAWQQAPR